MRFAIRDKFIFEIFPWQDSKFIDSTANSEEIRLALEEVSERVNEYQERAAEIKGYQKSFKVCRNYSLLVQITDLPYNLPYPISIFILSNGILRVVHVCFRWR